MSHGQDHMSFKDKDHFSGHADLYEAFRPTYPEALFAYLSSLCPRHDLAWDCATGNGQAAVPLAAYFRAVIATDASQKQIRPGPVAARTSATSSPRPTECRSTMPRSIS